MRKSLCFSFFSILSVLWMNSPSHAIGGKGTEEVPDQIIKSKGILKIQSKRGNGTAVLFKEGNGYLGLSAKHVFDNFSSKDNPIIAHLGDEQRNVVKVYFPSNKTDIVLFVLNRPFENVDDFPCLPKIETTASTYAGDIYGYGKTTQGDSKAPLANSSGICRIGRVVAADFHYLNDESQQFLNIDKAGSITDFSLKNILFSFSLFQNSESLDEKSLYNEESKFNKSLLANKCLPIKNSSTPMQLESSTCFTSFGDSGGPLISDDNQLYAICHRGNFMFQGGMYFDLYENLPNENQFAGFEIKVQGEILKIGFHTKDTSKLYIWFPSLIVRNSLQTDFNQYLNKNISDYFMNKSDFIQGLLEQERDGYFSRWLTKYHIYNTNYFVSIVQQKDWIERVMPLAFKHINNMAHKFELK